MPTVGAMQMDDSQDTLDTVAHLREEICKLTQEQCRALEDATFVPMSKIQEKAYANRRTKLLNLIKDFAERLRQQLRAAS
jgi:hypothetical protein